MFTLYLLDSSGKVECQVIGLSGVNITEKINSYSGGTFEIEDDNIYASKKYFREFKRAKLSYLENGIEKITIDGFLTQIESSEKSHKVGIEDFGKYLESRIIRKDFSFNNTKIKDVLSLILKHLNEAHDTGIELISEVEEEITVDFKAGKNFLSILKELENIDYDFKFRGNKLFFGKTIGIDKTSGKNFVIFKYDNLEPATNNIDKFKVKRTSKNLINGVLKKNQEGYSYNKSEESINLYGILSEKNEGSNESLLSEYKNGVVEYEISPLSDHYFETELGDTVKVYLDNGSDLTYFNGDLKVIEKSIKSGDKVDIKLKLSSGKTKNTNLKDYLKGLDSKITKLEEK